MSHEATDAFVRRASRKASWFDTFVERIVVVHASLRFGGTEPSTALRAGFGVRPYMY